MCLKHPTRDICVLLVPHARSVARPQMWQCAVQPSSCGDLITVWALRVFGPQNIIHFLLNSLSKCIIFSFIWHRFKCKLHILFHCIFFNHIGSFDTFISSLSWRLCPSLLNILLCFVFLVCTLWKYCHSIVDSYSSSFWGKARGYFRPDENNLADCGFCWLIWSW